MFTATPHRFLVPWDGSFKLSDTITSLQKIEIKSENWAGKLEEETRIMGEWQHRLFAHDRYAMLLIFQALDAGGKDSTIRHVFTGVNPAGVRVSSFKRPSELELNHDFLWRTTARLPKRGYIGVFNRSYYEEVLVVRVHRPLLESQRLPHHLISPEIWENRFQSIVDHERHLANEGLVILKFWLNVSRDEQRRRFLSRIDKPNKRWKFSAADVAEREYWDDYMNAYEQCLKATSRPWAPWYAIPADHKPFMRWQVAHLINAAFEQLDVDYPVPADDATKALEKARKRLQEE